MITTLNQHWPGPRIRGLVFVAFLALPWSAAADSCHPFWSAPLDPGCRIIDDLVTFDDGSGPALYALGFRCTIVQRWDGTSWTEIREGLPGSGMSPRRFHILDSGEGPDLYLVWMAPGAHWHASRWNGEAWVEPPPGLFVLPQGTPEPFAVSVYPRMSGDVGDGMKIYGERWVGNVPSLARWNGEAWEVIAEYINPSQLIMHDDGTGPALYVMGGFIEIAGQPAGGIARWDGNEWTTFLSPSYRLVFPNATASFDDGSGGALFIAGRTVIAGVGEGPFTIFKWDGVSLIDIGAALMSPHPNVAYGFHDMAVFDDGSGASLYVSGNFSYSGEPWTAGSIARWDGHQWHWLGPGVLAHLQSLAVFDDPQGPSLFAAGNSRGQSDFMQIGDTRARGIVQWVGCPNCYANCTNATTQPRLTVDDFTCFIDRFASLHPAADCDGNGQLDVDDFTCFIHRFVSGCP